MIAAATNPDVSGMTIGYAVSAVIVGMLLAGLLIYAAWTTRDGRVGPRILYLTDQGWEQK